MQHDPVETADLLAFVRTAESRSLTQAAAALGVPRATLSRRLERLEKRLAVRLLRRTTRSLTLTDAGTSFLHHARSILDAVEHAEASVRRADDSLRGDVRVSVPPMTSDSFLALVASFAQQHPEVRVHVFFSTAPVDLHRDGWDIALRAGTQLEPGLVARTVGRSKLVAVAAASYLQAAGTPRAVRDLGRHRLLLSYARDNVPQTHWSTKNGALHVEGSFFTNDTNMLLGMVRSGLGIAMLPLVYTRHLLATGELVQVLPTVLEADSQVAVIYVEREFMPPQVRAFADALIAWAPAELERIPQERHATTKKSARARPKRRRQA